jgi:hypothetical protein
LLGLNFAILSEVLRIRDVYPGSWILPIPDPGSLIPDPKTAIKRGVKKKLVVIPFFEAIKFTKLKIILFLESRRKKNWANFQRIIELFTQKIVTNLSKIVGLGSRSRDPSSGIRKKPIRIPDPGSRGPKGTGSRIRNTADYPVKEKG